MVGDHNKASGLAQVFDLSTCHMPAQDIVWYSWHVLL